MYLKWFGAALLVVSLLIAGIIATGIKTDYRTEDYARAKEDGSPMIDRTIEVPPFNSSVGWVGFNITLPNKQKDGYQAYGVILPADEDPHPQLQMRAVNLTGLDLLVFDKFDPTSSVWNETKQYATAYLDNNTRYKQFYFYNLDNCTEYVLLFRCGKEEDKNRPILISVKESWLEQKALLEPTSLNASLSVLPGVIGLGLLTYDRLSEHRRNKQRRRPLSKSMASARTGMR